MYFSGTLWQTCLLHHTPLPWCIMRPQTQVIVPWKPLQLWAKASVPSQVSCHSAEKELKHHDRCAPAGTVCPTVSFPWHIVMLWWPTRLPKLGAMMLACDPSPFKLGAWGRPGGQGDLERLSEFKSCCFHSIQWLQLKQVLSQPAISTRQLPVAVRPQGYNQVEALFPQALLYHSC